MKNRKRISLKWTVGPANAPDAVPDERTPAGVPGAVQLDWAQHLDLPPLHLADNFKRWEWMSASYWIYESVWSGDAVPADAEAWLVLEGVDYAFRVYLDDSLLHEQEGMFTPAEIPLPAAGSEGRIRVAVFPAPDSGDPTSRRAAANQSCKPPVSWGWDWHPSVVPLGLWKPAYVELRPRNHLAELSTSYRLSDDFSMAFLAVDGLLSASADESLDVSVTLLDPEGREIGHQTVPAEPGGFYSAVFEVRAPRLWWPHDHGEQPLYMVEARCGGADTGPAADCLSRRVGFRRVELVMNNGEWEREGRLKRPLERARPPMQLQVNGRQIFAKGTNWVNPDVFPGRITRAGYASLLDLGVGANFNIVRCWGGAIVNHESFFELCDERGLLVWQEFPLACNNYRDSDTYLQVLEQEAQSIVEQVRQHPCLCLWSGGNELFNSWSGMNDQSKALRLLNAICLDLDPDTPFIPTSPVMGVGHGDYRFNGDEEIFSLYPKCNFTAYTEFGCSSVASEETLRTIIPEADLWPPRRGTAWSEHHAFDAWPVDPDSWLMWSTIVRYFGEPGNLAMLIGYGQWLQAEGYRCIYEEARRQKPYCSMALNWCFNEPWPTAANNSLVEYPDKPKPALRAVGDACRPLLASVRVPQFSWKGGETFCVEPWILNDRHAVTEAGVFRVEVSVADRVVFENTVSFSEVGINGNRCLESMEVVLPAVAKATPIVVRAEIEGRPETASTYRFLLRGAEDQK